VTNEAFGGIKMTQLLKDTDWRLTDGISVRFGYPLDDGARTDCRANGRPQFQLRPLRDAKEAVIVQESTGHDSTSTDICRRHSIATSMLFRRRTMVGYGSGGQMKLRGC